MGEIDQLGEVLVAEVSGEAVVLSPIQLPTPLKVQLRAKRQYRTNLNRGCRDRRVDA